MQVSGRSIVFFVVIVGAVSFIAGWFITKDVRDLARQTDVQIELVAKSLQNYAAVHQGVYPTAPDALRAEHDPSLERALSVLQIRWPPTGDLAPVLEANGRPSGLGTLDRVNASLR